MHLMLHTEIGEQAVMISCDFCGPPDPTGPYICKPCWRQQQDNAVAWKFYLDEVQRDPAYWDSLIPAGWLQDTPTPKVRGGELRLATRPVGRTTRFKPRNPVLDELLNMQRGKAAEVAQRLGISRQALYCWREVPLKHLDAVARILRVSRSTLRPDLYPPRKQ